MGGAWFKVRAVSYGAHVELTFFLGEYGKTLANIGSLRVREDEVWTVLHRIVFSELEDLRHVR